MAIEIIPKPKNKAPRWLIIFLASSIIIFLAVVSSYLYFEITARGLSKKIEERKEALSEIPSPEQKALEEDLLLKEAKINIYGNLLSSHEKSDNVFNFLESICHPKVWFSEFNFNSDEKTVSIKGTAENFTAMAQQMFIFRSQELLKSITLSELSLGEEGGVDFSLQVTLDPQIYYK